MHDMTVRYRVSQKNARFTKNIPDQLRDDREGEIMENVDFKYSSNRASFMGNPVA